MDMMRYTVVDSRGGVSFVAPCEACFAMVAACAKGPENLVDLLEGADFYYHSLKDYVLSGLAVFDEHNLDGHYEAIHKAIISSPPAYRPVFRVLDSLTREASLRPVQAGVVIFNLRARRIIQVQNSYHEITRSGRVRVFDGSRFTSFGYSYHLPKEWSLVP